jgi:tetratricopeptide (TPR) repeat protein
LWIIAGFLNKTEENAVHRLLQKWLESRLQIMKPILALLTLFAIVPLTAAQTRNDPFDFKLALSDHNGLLTWHADGFKIVQASVKPQGKEIGFRGAGPDGIEFLNFLFIDSDSSQLTGSICMEHILDFEKQRDSTIKNSKTWNTTNRNKQSLAMVSYVSGNRAPSYHLRGFIAFGDLCATYSLDPDYVPQFKDAFQYAQIFYSNDMFKDAAPVFEVALQKLDKDETPDLDKKMWRRVATDNAGMAYGISGNLTKARAIFEGAIKTDPDYPIYYYNLACTDAEEGKLADARKNLELAFARKANVLPGESLPDPRTDDSFLPHKSNLEFWSFIEKLH